MKKAAILKFVETTNETFKSTYSYAINFFVGVNKTYSYAKIMPVDIFGNSIGNTWHTSTVTKIENTEYTLTIHTRNSVYVFLKVGTVELK
mgnify:CR=1 FL=1